MRAAAQGGDVCFAVTILDGLVLAKQTIVVELPLAEVAAKVRTGGPIDDEEDLEWPAWAGVIPLTLVAGERQ